MYDRHPNDLGLNEYNDIALGHYKEMTDAYKEAIDAGHAHEAAKVIAAHKASKAFLERVPEKTDIQKAWHNEHMDHVDNFLKNLNGLTEDVPTNSMAGGAIANKAMGLGGVRTHLVKREILRVLGKVRARNRTKPRA